MRRLGAGTPKRTFAASVSALKGAVWQPVQAGVLPGTKIGLLCIVPMTFGSRLCNGLFLHIPVTWNCVIVFRSKVDVRRAERGVEFVGCRSRSAF